MKNKSCFILILLVFYHTNAQTSIFNDLLQKHVTKNGVIDYTSLKTEENKFF